MTAKDTQLAVEVVYALPDQQTVISLTVTSGTTVAAAIEQSGILSRFPAINLQHSAVGIFGVRVGLKHKLGDGDRIEIYRPLEVDPKMARRQRAVLAAANDGRGRKGKISKV